MQSMELQRVGHNLLPEQQSNKKETTVGETSQRTSTRCLSFIRNCFVQEILKQIRHRFWSSGAHKRVWFLLSANFRFPLLSTVLEMSR